MHDVVVVGAGSAGAALAARLSEDAGRSVLLVEAGPDYPDVGALPDQLKYGRASATVPTVNDHNWHFVGQAVAGREMPVPRGKVTGGTSAINGQVFLRGVPEDYDAWAAAGNEDWSYERMLPYLRMVEADRTFPDSPLHRSDGPIGVHRFPSGDWLAPHAAFYEACRAMGFPDCPDANDPASTGVGPYPFNNPDGIRISTALGYLAAARSRENLTILPDAFARRILFDERRATGLEVEIDGRVTIVEGREIVLCAGAIGSPHLLLLSGVGPAGQLGELGIPVVADVAGVGGNLMDHAMIEMQWRMRPEFAPVGDQPLLQVALRYTASGSELRNDMWVCSVVADDTLRLVGGLNHQASTGELRLRSTDPHVQPFLDYNYLADESDVRRLRETVRTAVELVRHERLAAIVTEPIRPAEADLASDEALDAWLRDAVTTAHHVSGTCRMAPAADDRGVVDGQGRVRGVEDLRVVDASIMPTIIRANLNLTTIAMAERIADVMRRDV